MENLNEILDLFMLQGEIVSYKPYGAGHINQTYYIETSEKKYILQKVNGTIFKSADSVMSNIIGVTEFLKKKTIEAGKDVEKYALYLIKTKTDEYYINNELGIWRCYNFIDGSLSIDKVETTDQMYYGGLGFGTFQHLLKDYDATTLYETIENFHNTPIRFENFKKALAADKMGRAKNVAKEIEFFLNNEEFYSTLVNLQKAGELPLKVTHNDTKLNNMLLDKDTLEPLCVIDLDTVMPGLSAYDFGDTIRVGTTMSVEDEQDLSKVNFDINFYKAFAEGFIKGLKGELSDSEIKALPIGARMMTIECGMRFLTDYLEGDVYFRISRENHNLDRSRTQIKLYTDMTALQDEMTSIVMKF